MVSGAKIKGKQGRFGITLLALFIGLGGLSSAVAGPAISPGTSAPGTPGDPGSASSTDFGLRFSNDVIFNPTFTSPLQQIFSAPSDFPGVGTSGRVPGDLWNSDTQLLSALVTSAAADPQIAPMASVLATLVAPAQLRQTYSSMTQRGLRDYYCLTQAQQNARQYRYWSFTVLGEPDANGTKPFLIGSAMDREAANNPADTNDEWCSANLPKATMLEPFTMNIWGPVVVLSLGIFAFWAARGFRKP